MEYLIEIYAFNKGETDYNAVFYDVLVCPNMAEAMRHGNELGAKLEILDESHRVFKLHRVKNRTVV